MKARYCLYTDELGEFTPKRYKYSPVFMVTGCIIETGQLQTVKHNLELVKYKYWNNTKINFHSKEIGKKEKDSMATKR